MKPGGPLARNSQLARRTPLIAKTALKASGAALSRETKLKVRGAKTVRMASFQDLHRALALERANGRCDLCGRWPAATRSPDSLEWHHLFGRSIGIKGGTRWVNVVEMTCGACATCHRDWHDGRTSQADMANPRWRALRRLVDVYFTDDIHIVFGAEPLAVARELIGLLVERGVEPRCSR